MAMSLSYLIVTLVLETYILLISGYYHHHYDQDNDHEIATASCIALGPERSYIAAIPRKCVGGESCNSICQSVTDMNEDWDAFNKKPQCIDALHIYSKRGLKNTPNAKWVNTWRYGSFSCAATHCGPNFCCCSQ